MVIAYMTGQVHIASFFSQAVLKSISSISQMVVWKHIFLIYVEIIIYVYFGQPFLS